MMREYTILRDVSIIRGPVHFGPTSKWVQRIPPEPKIEMESLTASDVRDLSRDPNIFGIAPIMPTKLITPFDAAAESQAIGWGISAVRADVSDFAGTDVVVSVLDTGIDASHPVFRGMNIQQEDFTGGGNGDRNGHGTHCAGTIFGRDVNGVRIGVARGVTTALIGKVLGDAGGGSSEMIFRAIQWAIEKNAHVISMSLGFDFPGLVAQMQKQGWPVELATSVALEAFGGNLRMFDALMGMIKARTAFGDEVVVIAAAGNESRRDQDPNFEIATGLPAAADGVISVGALTQSANGFKVAPFSNTLPQISAPGVNIVSSQAGGGLRPLSGTSMACPHVAGVAALWWQAIRQSGVPATARSVIAKLLATARTEVFAPNVEVADRGAGVVTAP